MSRPCKNCQTLAELNSNQAKTIATLQAKVEELTARLQKTQKNLEVWSKGATGNWPAIFIEEILDIRATVEELTAIEIEELEAKIADRFLYGRATI